jgi:hypothetical protein
MHPKTRLSSQGRYELFYTPFEAVNRFARLVIVGITPGPTQIRISYESVQELLRKGLPDDQVLAGAKSAGGFGGSSMRPNLLRMLNHFGFAKLLGIPDVEALWGASSDLLHSTSVVPHGAFKNGAMFAGSFAEVLGSPALRKSFEEDFIASLPGLSPDALYVALGPTPLAALDWCAANGLVRSQQVLGAFAHASSQSGSQVAVYLGEKRPEDLKLRDPVRSRLDFLLSAAQRLRYSISQILSANSLDAGLAARTSGATALSSCRAPADDWPPSSIPGTEGDEVPELHYVVARGSKAGTILRPHIHEDGCVVVSLSRYEQDYVRLRPNADISIYLDQGYGLRMSAPGRAPSLISAGSVRRGTAP